MTTNNVPALDIDRIAMDVHVRCSCIPGANFYSAAEMAIRDAIEKLQPAMPALPEGYVAMPEWFADQAMAAYNAAAPDLSSLHPSGAAQSAASAPEPLQYSAERHDLYVTGWNDCRAAMLSGRPGGLNPVAVDAARQDQGDRL